MEAMKFQHTIKNIYVAEEKEKANPNPNQHPGLSCKLSLHICDTVEGHQQYATKLEEEIRSAVKISKVSCDQRLTCQELDVFRGKDADLKAKQPLLEWDFDVNL